MLWQYDNSLFEWIKPHLMNEIQQFQFEVNEHRTIVSKEENIMSKFDVEILFINTIETNIGMLKDTNPELFV